VTSNGEASVAGSQQILVDFETAKVTVVGTAGRTTYPLGSREAFDALSSAWLRAGWEVKYPYTFTWLGRPVIQMPEDLLRAQEAIYRINPDVIIETGVAHGGSLVYFATLCRALNRGRVIGIDVEIRPGNRTAIEAHVLSSLITLVEGNSTDPAVVSRVRASIRPEERVIVFLDSNHTKAHVLAELDAYADLVSDGSFVVVTDGVMQEWADSPRAGADWRWNNPRAAAEEFLARRPDFKPDPPPWLFNESLGLDRQVVTYWPDGWLRRRQPQGVR
jgi:cephalosporin hydroxylase